VIRLTGAVAGLVLVALATAASSCGNQPVPAQQVVNSPSATAKPDLSGVLSVDGAAARVVTLNLDLGSGPALNGFNINGLGKGRLQIAVPVGWTIHVNCHNAGSLRHSCGVVEGAETGQLAFSGASTASPISGLAPGQSGSFTFLADRVGSFRITCLVPGHMEAGMWASLDVTAAGVPTVGSV
jgi:hypothetical protein